MKLSFHLCYQMCDTVLCRPLFSPSVLASQVSFFFLQFYFSPTEDACNTFALIFENLA